MLKHYVRRYSPGILFAESSDVEISRRDPVVVELKKHHFGFRFFDREEVEQDGDTLRDKDKNLSGMFYPNGKTYTLAQVKEYFPAEKILISNMKGNGYDMVVRHRGGGFMPFEQTDRVMD